MQAILVRIGIDQAYGAWNAPVDPATRRFVYVPIPDGPGKEYRAGDVRPYQEIVPALSDFAHKCNASDLCCPPALRQRTMHLDPDFEYLTYGDNGLRRGARIAALRPNDLLVFYAGLRSVTEPKRLVYALVGVFIVDQIIRAIDISDERRRENAHTRWRTISADDVIVRGRPGESGRFEYCIPIGEWRDRAYRVRSEIEKAWGGLTVRNGYLQRSAVPPAFRDCHKFCCWFRRQHVTLIQRNN